MAQLHEKATAQTCPACRQELPPSRECLFNLALCLIANVNKTVGPFVGTAWGPLPTAEQKDMEGAKLMLTEALNQVGKQYRMRTRSPDLRTHIHLRTHISTIPPPSPAAAIQGHTTAAVYLGHIYLYGQGVPTDGKRALEYYEMAAAEGDCEAQYQVGAMRLSGTYGVEQDFEEAHRWLCKSMKQGYAEATHLLARMYHLGIAPTTDGGNSWRRARALYKDALHLGGSALHHRANETFENAVRAVRKKVRLAPAAASASVEHGAWRLSAVLLSVPIHRSPHLSAPNAVRAAHERHPARARGCRRERRVWPSRRGRRFPLLEVGSGGSVRRGLP